MNMGRPKKEDKVVENKIENTNNKLDTNIDIEKLIEEKAKELFDRKMKKKCVYLRLSNERIPYK